MTAASYGDAIPSGWRCQQTYFRNHVAMNAALRCLHQQTRESGQLAILELGGGVIEPLLLGALVQDRWGDEFDYSIRVVDPSPDVHGLLRAMCTGHSWSFGRGDDMQLIYDSTERRLHLPGLARVFSSPESLLNQHFVAPELLEPSLAEMSALGLLSYFELTSDSRSAAAQLVNEGLRVPLGVLRRIQVTSGAFPEVELGGRYDLIVANFSIQYPVMEGKSEAVVSRLETLLSPDGLLLHGATYGAQVHLLREFSKRRGWSAAFGVRELDEVTYVDDATVRLRIRTDALVTKRPAQTRSLTFNMPANFSESSLDDVIARLSPDDGTQHTAMMAFFVGDLDGNYKGHRTVHAHLLRCARPLPCRVK